MPDRGSCLWSAANEPPAVPKDHLHHHAIESLNYQLQKIIQNRGHFPTDEAMIKPLRINKIGVASSCVGPPQPPPRRQALLLVRRAAKRREVAGAGRELQSQGGVTGSVGSW